MRATMGFNALGNVCSSSSSRIESNHLARTVLPHLQTAQPSRNTFARNRNLIMTASARNDLPAAEQLALADQHGPGAVSAGRVPQTLHTMPDSPASTNGYAVHANGTSSNGAHGNNGKKVDDRRQRAAIVESLQQLKADVNSLSSSTSINHRTSKPNAPDSDDEFDQPPEAGILPDAALTSLKKPNSPTSKTPVATKSKSAGQIAPAVPSVKPPVPVQAAASPIVAAAEASASYAAGGLVYPPEERNKIRTSWNSLMRWSRFLRNRELIDAKSKKLEKVVVFGGGSFGTAMGVALARSRPEIQVVLLLRDAYLCRDINELHCNTRYLKDDLLPMNVTATTSAVGAITGAQYAIHAVPVQHTRAFLAGIKDILPANVPIISVSKGIEVGTGQLMSDLIPSALGRKQPAAFLSGPSFAKEVMAERPTGIVAASKDKDLVRDVQRLFASPSMRVNTSTDVVGVEICGSLKNVLAIAAGIVEGLDLGHNAMAALVAQGCAEIRWLAEKMGAKSATISGLSGLGDIMLTCYGSLSRNRSVGVRLGKGEKLQDILASSSQVAEGVATAGVVVSLALKYRVQLPVLTAVAQVLDGHISAREAVFEIMNLPQIEER